MTNALLPGIEFNDRTFQVETARGREEDGLSEEEAEVAVEEEEAEILSILYTLRVDASAAKAAEKKAMNAVRARHPSDALSVDLEGIRPLRSGGGLLKEVGLREQFRVSVRVFTDG